MIRRRHKYRPWVDEKQHIEIFSVANFVLSKNYLVMKRFVLNIVLFKKKDFWVVVYKTQGKKPRDRKGNNNEMMQLKTFNEKMAKNLLKKMYL